MGNHPSLKSGGVVWLTGLSASGKSTLAEHIVQGFKDLNMKVEWIDGDDLRKEFPQTGFSEKERQDHVKRVGFWASRLENHGIWVIVSLISPFTSTRDYARMRANRFFEIYVSTPLSVCQERDPKGIYQKYKSGMIQNLTGLDQTYEVPKTPELIIDTSAGPSAKEQATLALEKILSKV